MDWKKTRYFTLGCKDLVVAVDHKPLLKILGDRKLEDIPNERLLRLKERTLRWKFTVVHIPGKHHKAADAGSRHPSGPAEIPKMDANEPRLFGFKETSESGLVLNALYDEEELEMITERTEEKECLNAAGTVNSLETGISSLTWASLKEACVKDTTTKILKEQISKGFPEDAEEVPFSIRHYYQYRDNLSIVEDVPVYNNQAIIPETSRKRVLSTLHSAHQGISSMTARAKESVFWPGITDDIKKMRERCQPCNRMAPTQPDQPPSDLEYPSYPFEKIAVDYFSYMGRNYLIIVDRYSGWPEIALINDGGSRKLITMLKTVFTTFGIPRELASDGGAEFIAYDTQNSFNNGVLRIGSHQ